jgi:hypothetical protein
MSGSDHPFNPMAWEVAKIVKHAQKHLKLQIEDLRKIMAVILNDCSVFPDEHVR